MRKLLLVVGATLALSGCDRIQGVIGMDGDGNGTAANRTRTAAADDALISNLQPIGEPGPGQDQGPTEGPPSQGEDQPQQPPGPQEGPPSGAIDPSMLVGRWGDNGSCAQVIEFFANGTFRAANGGTGNWRIDGDRLTMFNGNRRVTLRLRSITARRVVAEDQNGGVGESIRC